uniref:Secreted protein n=1 Tax=Heterorhabditis bacteriophora TaxID=37862 RepID=A0A1I7X3G2_HETBA
MLVNKLAKPLAKRTTATANNRVPLHAETTSRTTARISVTSSALLLLALVNPSVSKPVPTPANKLLRLWSRVSSPLPAVDAAAVIPSVEGRAVADAEHYFSPEDRETRKLNSTTHVCTNKYTCTFE